MAIIKTEGDMLENQTELKNRIHEQADAFRRLNPEFSRAEGALTQCVYKNGVLSAKTKRLIAMTTAIVQGCRACILYQTEAALNLGAGVDEILECIGVAVSLGGTLAEGQATRVIEFLEEKKQI
ncbi:carboxymuconolactone decarboxylase family protein [uncultured Desulfobacter sp.]|uniref:carboxymuconolactone decarboxylase family protein n=1 Tax=uncultured Desulfobacter sp. TaxID=240139 RepID=UPI002AA74AF7|nr:carboxymuconolactone decarboxylase family protein [uncultured Desulfobacter sp.]